MQNIIKKNIKVLAKRFGFQIGYLKEQMIVYKEHNEIKLSFDKYGVQASFESDKGHTDLRVSEDEICGLIIELMNRKDINAQWRNPGVLHENLFLESEGQTLSECLKEIKNNVVRRSKIA